VPKLVDYAVRFDFLREGAFEVVLRQGVAALSRRAVADALGTSVNTVRRLLAEDAHLVSLAADEVDRRRRNGRLSRLRDAEPVDAAVHLLRKCLPDTEARVAEELVWLRLVLATTQVPEDRDRDGLVVSERFRIYERGYVDEDEPSWAPAPTAPSPLEGRVAEREAAVSALVHEAVDLLGCPDLERVECERDLRTQVSGLTLEVCLGALTPDEAVAALARAVQRWCPARVAE
jgi:hypothetical protein